MKKIDYELKSALLNTDLVKVAKKIHLYNNLNYYKERGFIYNKELSKYQKFESSLYIPSNKEVDDMFEFYFGQNYSIFFECLKIANAEYKRKNRLYDRIVYYLNKGKCYFVTLTFSDDVLINTTPQQRKRRVTEFLKQNYKGFIANIDYGSQYGREHYHAFVLFDKKVDFSLWYNNKYKSLINSIPVRINNNTNIKKIATYIAKLTNHAIKNTTKRNALIYSRDKF